MLFKKTILMGTFLGLASMSMLANADPDALNTYNYTDHDSAVVVTSGIDKGKCTGTLPSPFTQFTPAGTPTNPGQSHVEWDSVGALCLLSPGNICTADIHMTRDCSDSAVARVSLNLKSHVVTVNQTMGDKFVVTAEGNRVNLNEKSRLAS